MPQGTHVPAAGAARAGIERTRLCVEIASRQGVRGRGRCGRLPFHRPPPLHHHPHRATASATTQFMRIPRCHCTCLMRFRQLTESRQRRPELWGSGQGVVAAAVVESEAVPLRLMNGATAGTDAAHMPPVISALGQTFARSVACPLLLQSHCNLGSANSNFVNGGACVRFPE
eukprot:gene10081-biopygen3464